MRGTVVRNAYDLLGAGVRSMTFPVQPRERYQDAYFYFAKAIVVDANPETFDPEQMKAEVPYDAKLLAMAETCKTGYWRGWSWLSYVLVAASLEGVNAAIEGAPNAELVPFGDMDRAERYAKLGCDLDKDREAGTGEGTDYVGHWCLGHFLVNTGRDAAAGLDCYRKAVSLNGDNNANLLAEYSEALIAVGAYDEALTQVERAKRRHAWYGVDAAWTLYFKGMQDPRFYNLALAELRSIVALPSDVGYPGELHLVAAAVLARLSRQREAEHALAQFRAAKPGWTLADEQASVVFLNEQAKAHWLGGCQAAGLT